MPIKSIFDPTNPDYEAGGMNTITGSIAGTPSSMPESLVDGKVEAEEEDEAAKVVDGTDLSNEAVNQIAEALDESHHADDPPAKVTPPDGPG